MNRLNVISFVLCVGAISAGAQTIISVTGTSAGVDNEEAVGQVSWTQTTAYTGVTIRATIESCETSTGSAYLTLNGTALANQIAVNNSLSVNNADTTVTLFSGLTLGPGTYFLTISPTTSGDCNELWQNIGGTPAVTTGAGVTAGSSGATGSGHTVAAYPPASSFLNSASYLFSVTGTAAAPSPTPTPVPPTAILLGVGLLFLVWYARRYRQQSNPL